MKALIYFDGTVILTVVGIKSETEEAFLTRVKAAILVTVLPSAEDK